MNSLSLFDSKISLVWVQLLWKYSSQASFKIIGLEIIGAASFPGGKVAELSLFTSLQNQAPSRRNVQVFAGT